MEYSTRRPYCVGGLRYQEGRSAAPFRKIRRAPPFEEPLTTAIAGEKKSRRISTFSHHQFKMSSQNVKTTHEVHKEKSDLSAHCDYAVKGFRGKDRRKKEQFGKRLLEAVKGRMKGVMASGGKILQLLENTNNTYSVSTTRKSIEELHKAGKTVDDFMTNQNVDGKSRSSEKVKVENDGGGAPDDDPGGTNANTYFESSSGYHGIAEKHGNNRQQTPNTGRSSSSGSGAGESKRMVTFTLYPPILQNSKGPVSYTHLTLPTILLV